MKNKTPQPGDILVVFDAFHDELEKISASKNKLPWWLADQITGVPGGEEAAVRAIARDQAVASRRQGVRRSEVPGKGTRIGIPVDRLIYKDRKTGRVIARKVGPEPDLTGRPSPGRTPVDPIQDRLLAASVAAQDRFNEAKQNIARGFSPLGKLFRRKKPLSGD